MTKDNKETKNQNTMADKKKMEPIDYMRVSIEVMKNSVQEERAEGEVSPKGSGGQELSYTLGTQYIPSNKSHRWAA